MEKNLKLGYVSVVSFDSYDSYVSNIEYKTDITDTDTLPTHALLEILNEVGIKEKAMAFLYLTYPSSYSDIANFMDINYDNLIRTMKRDANKEYFREWEKKGKTKYFILSERGFNYLNDLVKIYEEERIKKAEREKELENELIGQQQLLIEIKNFINLHKKELKSYKNVFPIDFSLISEFSFELAEALLTAPEENIKLFEKGLKETLGLDNARLELFNLPKTQKLNIQDMRANALTELISITGRVVSLSNVRPQVVSAKFECTSCGTVLAVEQIEKKFREPSRCSCNRRGNFKLISKQMVDTARVILEDLQEKTDNPHSSRLNVFIKEHLTNKQNIKMFYPGNEVEIVGILKEVPVPLRDGGVSTRFELALEVNSAQNAQEEVDINSYDEETINQIKEVSDEIDNNGLEKFVESYGNHIEGLETIKEASIVQLAEKVDYDKNKVLNMLLIGDPGIAKTEIGKYSIKITPGARAATGGSSSAVGLTASVIKDDISGYRVEPGVLVVAKHLCLIDEFNNIQEEDKPKLQEALGDLLVTISKANIRMSLKCNSNTIATANPKEGTFKDGDIIKQFDLTKPMIDRFPLIFILKDDTISRDIKIAEKMVNRTEERLISEYSEDFIKKFLVYIREQPTPTINKESAAKIAEIYSILRKENFYSNRISPRFNNALILLSKRYAKLRLSNRVEDKDIERAVNLLSQTAFKTPNYESVKIKLEEKNGS